MAMAWARAWNKRPVVDRVKIAHEAGLEGRRGSADWGNIRKKERKALLRIMRELSVRHQKRRAKIVSSTAQKLGVSANFLHNTGQRWLQDGREPTLEEFQNWARKQHEKACKHYTPAWPLGHYNGKCQHCIEMKRPCTSFFAHTGICETGYFEPDRIKTLPWNEFQKMYRRAMRKVNQKLGEVNG